MLTIILLAISILSHSKCNGFALYKYPSNAQLLQRGPSKNINALARKFDLLNQSYSNNVRPLKSVGMEETSKSLIGDDSASFSLQDQVSLIQVLFPLSILSISIHYVYLFS